MAARSAGRLAITGQGALPAAQGRLAGTWEPC